MSSEFVCFINKHMYMCMYLFLSLRMDLTDNQTHKQSKLAVIFTQHELKQLAIQN